MHDRTLVVDVVDPRLVAPDEAAEGIFVLVEPLYGVVAIAVALDAGWGSVELAREVPGQPPIPLVSWEQSPAVEHRGGRCRARAADLHASARDGAILGAPVLARPLGAQLVARAPRRVTFLPVPCAGELSADAWWASGMLVRVLLDELDELPTHLTDAAGLAVTIARGAEDPVAQLGAGARWRRHLHARGAADDLRVAAAVDSLGVVPQLRRAGEAWVAEPWLTPAAGPPEDRT